MSDFVSQGTPSEKSLDTDGPGGGGRVVGAKGDRSRRSWSPSEEEVLLLALKDLVSNRWKSDNGFRAGYLTRVEEILKRELPTTDMKVHPHIQSKINTWKRCYHSLSLILDRSGVGFNSDGDWKIECNDEQWAQIVKADSNARYMRYKAWPYYEDWKHIYGKDRAARMRVEGMTQAYSKMGAVPSPNSETFVDAVNMNLDDLFTQEEIQESLQTENVVESSYKGVKSPAASSKSSRKRKAGAAMEAILEAMTKMNDDTNNRLDTLSARIGYDFDLSVKRTEISKLLQNIPGLDRKQKFLASDILVKEPERLDLFMGYEEDEKADYLMHILEEKHGV